MKKLFLLCSFMFLVVAANAQSQRLVLIEEFGQASCPPCAVSNPILHNYLDTTNVNIVLMSYQVSWPGFDPMYFHNEAEVDARVELYEVSGVPNSVVDGNVFNGAPLEFLDGWTPSTIANRAAMTSPFTFNVSHSLSTDFTTLNVTGDVTVSGAVNNSNLVLHVVVVEKHIAFATPPGSTDEKDFYNVMKKFLPNSSGTPLAASYNIGDQISIDESWVYENVYDINELAVIAFIQDTNNKEIMQAGFSENIMGVPALPNVEAEIADMAAPSGLCDETYTPSVEITNISSNSIDTFEVSYSLNGGTPVSELVTVSLGAGQATTITFPQTTMQGGENEIEYHLDINSHNSDVIDISSINNVFSPDPVVILGNDVNLSIDEDFQSMDWRDEHPSGGISLNPDAIWATHIDSAYVVNVFGYNSESLGGFGNSDGCYSWIFYDILSGSSMLVFEKIDLRNTYNNYLKFSHAYAQYASSTNDQLEVLASTDCGVTWTELFNKAGNALATAPIHGNNTLFFPTSSEWEETTINLSTYDGESELVIAFRGTSDYGNNLFIDNIKTEGWVVNTQQQNEFAAVHVFPNPADEQVNIQLDLTEASDMTVEIVNALGQTVQQVTTQTFQAGQHNLNVNTSELPSGLYMVALRKGNALMNKRFVVTH